MSTDSEDIKPKRKINVKSSISNKVKVHKDPLFNIGDIVKHRIYPFVLRFESDPLFQKSLVNRI